MHDHQMNPPPTIVAKRKNHLVSGSRGPPLASCEDAGERKRVAVASAKPPIHIGGKMTFMKKVWADESSFKRRLGGKRPHLSTRVIVATIKRRTSGATPRLLGKVPK